MGQKHHIEITYVACKCIREPNKSTQVLNQIKVPYFRTNTAYPCLTWLCTCIVLVMVINNKIINRFIAIIYIVKYHNNNNKK